MLVLAEWTILVVVDNSSQVGADSDFGVYVTNLSMTLLCKSLHWITCCNIYLYQSPSVLWFPKDTASSPSYWHWLWLGLSTSIYLAFLWPLQSLSPRYLAFSRWSDGADGLTFMTFIRHALSQIGVDRDIHQKKNPSMTRLKGLGWSITPSMVQNLEAFACQPSCSSNVLIKYNVELRCRGAQSNHMH
jgi:hypothetical protein